MLTNTFRHLRGISGCKEASLWRAGILTWDDYDAQTTVQQSLFADPLHYSNSPLNPSRRALQENNLDFFARTLDRQQHFRIALAYPRETLFLDIETTGLSWYYDRITLVGWSVGGKFDFLIAGESPDKLFSAIANAKVLVTFNGTMFDLPFLKRTYPELHFPPIHVDLRFLAKRVGLTGGQKEIERKLKLHRGKNIEQVIGENAPILWHRFVRGDTDSLMSLIEYNRADVYGMEFIFDKVIDRLIKKEEIPNQLRGNIPPFFSRARTKNRASKELTSRVNKCSISLSLHASKPALHITDLLEKPSTPDLRVVGIDLTGSESRASGWCLLVGNRAETRSLNSDDEIIRETIAAKPNLISIDSPLSLPHGRNTVFDDDPGREEFGIVRHCERTLKKRGVNVYPALIPSMQRLTARGIRLAQKFRNLGFPVIESYPGAAQDIMNIPRKHAGLAFLEEGLSAFGVAGEFIGKQVSHDELDAITSAVVGVFFWAGRFEALGAEAEEALVIPDLNVDPTQWLTRSVIAISGNLDTQTLSTLDNLQPQSDSVCIHIDGEHSHRVELDSKNIFEVARRNYVRNQIASAKPAQRIIVTGVSESGDLAQLFELFGPTLTHILVKQEGLHQATCCQQFPTFTGQLSVELKELLPKIINLIQRVN